MGYLLKQVLKTLCGVNHWSYAIFWKIGCQNPKLLIWEECYCEPNGVQASNKLHSLVAKMMKDNYINLLGEGLVGRVAFTRNHQWIILDNKMLGVHPPEVSNEVYAQFSAGIRTIAVIPVHPHGVVQLGSSSPIMENLEFVNDVKSLISQLGCVPGALLSENYMKNEGALDSISTGKSEFTSDGCNQRGYSPQTSGSTIHNRVANGSALASSIFCPNSGEDQCQSSSFRTNGGEIANLYSQDPKQTAFGLFSANHDPFRSMEQHIVSDPFLRDDTMAARKSHDQLAVSSQPRPTSELFQALTMSSEEACLKPPSRDDLFDIVGMDFRNKLFSGNWNNFANNRVEANPPQSAGSDLFPVCDGESDSSIYSSTASDHLLDAVVSKVHSASKQIADGNISCSRKASSSSLAPVWDNHVVSVPKSLKKTASCYSYKSGMSTEDGGNFSDTSSIISSQISSWNDQRHNVTSECASKSNRKRLKPGENPRPRPKDRQMIQDRVKELREIIPNGAKCSIDALLERTIKHMVFLQGVTKHAEKLKQTGESKIVSKEGGLLLRDNFEGGATWAYEVGSQSMVCPIIVEDLNSPRQMLVEMVCEESGWFLEIADVVKGLGLTILKGVMESRNDKIWAHFTVEANRDVTRMEIFMALVSLFEQAQAEAEAVKNI